MPARLRWIIGKEKSLQQDTGGSQGKRVTGFEPVISTLGKSHVGHYTKPANYSLMQRIIADGGEKVKRSG